MKYTKFFEVELILFPAMSETLFTESMWIIPCPKGEEKVNKILLKSVGFCVAKIGFPNPLFAL